MNNQITVFYKSFKKIYEVVNMRGLGLMKEKAYFLEGRGLFRRAKLIWHNISLDKRFSEYERDLAMASIKRLSNIISGKVCKQRKKLSMHPDRYKNIEADRERVLQLFRTGLTPKEIQEITHRSRAFIYNCKKSSSTCK